MELSERKKEILKSVVDAYIASGEPVGSKFLTTVSQIPLSSATIRNEMSELEEMGYLEQPHTSAGRVPTALGYRTYVNSLMERYRLSLEELSLLNELTAYKMDELGKIMEQASHVISEVTNYPTFAVIKPPESDVNRYETVLIDDHSFLLIMIGANGTVRNRNVRLKSLIDQEALEALRKAILAVLNRHGIRAYDWHQKRGLRHLVVRGFEGRYQCTLVTGEEQLPQELIDDLLQLEGLVSLWQSIQTAKKTPDIFGPKMILLGGQRSLTMHLHGLRIPISPRSFFQLNTAQAANLYACIDAMVEPGCKRIVEAYSGIGGISMYLKDKAEEVIGIEIIKDAVLDARKAAERNGIHNVEFICADAADKLTYLSKKKNIDVLVVDPPRSGLDDLMLETMLRSRITKIIYVSCNPSTLAKNLAVLSERYEVRQIVPFDMFPHTANLETIVQLERRQGRR
mgnify:CR=1 FL=1